MTWLESHKPRGGPINEKKVQHLVIIAVNSTINIFISKLVSPVDKFREESAAEGISNNDTRASKSLNYVVESEKEGDAEIMMIDNPNAEKAQKEEREYLRDKNFRFGNSLAII